MSAWVSGSGARRESRLSVSPATSTNPRWPTFTDRIEAGVAEASHSVIVDLTNVEFLGLSGVQALAVEKIRAERSAVEMLLVPGGRGVIRPLTVAGLRDRFLRFGSVREAVESVCVGPARLAG
ncbi:STAS domain-containing protein [Rhodococcus sp. NPDC003348]